MPSSSVRDALAAVIRALPDATMILLAGGEIQLWNGRVTHLFGYVDDELLGRPVEGLVAAPERSRLMVALAAGCGSGAFIGVRKDGTEIAVRFCINAVEISATEPRTLVMVLRPESIEAGAAEVLAGAPDALVVVQRDRRILLVNDRTEALFGYASAELLGRPIEVLVPARLAARHEAACEEYFLDPHVRSMHAPSRDLLGQRKDGTEFPVDIMLSPVRTRSGLVAIASVRDATSRKALEDTRVELARAEEAMKLRDEFVSLVAHELRTPLTSLRLLVDTLVKKCSSEPSELNPELASGLLKVSTAVARAQRVVDDLIDVTQIIDSGVALRRERVDLGVIAQDELDRARARTTNGIDCTFAVLAKKPVIGTWDRARLRQLVAHLLSNAIKYCAGNPVHVTVDCDADQAILAVHDEGIGVPPEGRDRLFERFARFGSSSHYGGLGLGLWIVREIVEAHGGQVTVSSSGAGATFRVSLPLAFDSPSTASGSPSTASGR